MENKNINVEISKLMSKIYNCCNESQLPISVISLILSNINNEIKAEEFNYLQDIKRGDEEKKVKES